MAESPTNCERYCTLTPDKLFNFLQSQVRIHTKAITSSSQSRWIEYPGNQAKWV